MLHYVGLGLLKTISGPSAAVRMARGPSVAVRMARGPSVAVLNCLMLI